MHEPTLDNYYRYANLVKAGCEVLPPQYSPAGTKPYEPLIMYNQHSPFMPYSEPVMGNALTTLSLVVDQEDDLLSGMDLDEHKVLFNVLKTIVGNCHNYPHTHMSRWAVNVKPTSTIGTITMEIRTVCYANSQGCLPAKTVLFTMPSSLAKEVKVRLDDLALSCRQALNRGLPPNARWSE